MLQFATEALGDRISSLRDRHVARPLREPASEFRGQPPRPSRLPGWETKTEIKRNSGLRRNNMIKL